MLSSYFLFMNKPKKQKTKSALDIAKFFIWKASKEGKSITNKQLQKLLYYSQAWHLVYKEEPIFKEEIEAWVHGPAIKVVYNKYKKYGYRPIELKVNDAEISDIPNQDLLEEIWRVYGKYDGDYLEQLSHNEDPWQNARGQIHASVSSNNVISLEDMKAYYSSLIKKSS
ncbi:DUF4065 domain-containing protein [Candidatus Dojkabacteria bacterium]|nr:DUF4065 domain-containing protein [Candidatus Dojkabacteria bacterium]